MGQTVSGLIRLTRPANLPTAAADILAGMAIALGLAGMSPATLGSELLPSALLLVAASKALYAGGVVLNDVFDAGLDAVERPERPIPSGMVRRGAAGGFGALLLLAGMALAYAQSLQSAGVALILAISILWYDALAKKNGFFGPLAMGICRGLNLALGMSLLPLGEIWVFLGVPLVYIFAITTVSRGEVHGSGKKPLILAVVFYAIVIFTLGYLVWYHQGNLPYAVAFLALFAILVFRPLLAALREPLPSRIRKAVKWGVIGIIAMDAAWAAGFGDWWLGLMVLLLLPLARWLAGRFAVT
ncbi:UbiA-like protein EboC [Robiginitalea sp. M366]|uniref:UbiA-like protein EboC n=1 Tax=Robiginitalea aestuariiviva TaxID=3036903 RepID=UPI00240DEAD0|nr:UbiA-like protein EboC [Robiginitalea aestuariiviva]MDG1572613.1 UbiA-like protein EboC [Robiginitalea aestuariiviva]